MNRECEAKSDIQADGNELHHLSRFRNQVKYRKSPLGSICLQAELHLWGTSATQARRIAADAQRQMGEFSQKMLAHQEQCPYCLVAKPSAAGNSD
jgi:hypothetical protein